MGSVTATSPSGYLFEDSLISLTHSAPHFYFSKIYCTGLILSTLAIDMDNNCSNTVLGNRQTVTQDKVDLCPSDSMI